jgi:predicted MFS family arabinose efflux permease
VGLFFQMAPPKWQSTAQSLLNTIYNSLGAGLGALFGGWVMQHYGAIVMYRGSGAIIFVLFVIRAVAMTVGRCWNKRARMNVEAASEYTSLASA